MKVTPQRTTPVNGSPTLLDALIVGLILSVLLMVTFFAVQGIRERGDRATSTDDRGSASVIVDIDAS